MKKEDLAKLGLDEKVIYQIFAIHGKDLEKMKTSVSQTTAERDTLKTQLTEANQQIESFKGMNIDEIKKNADDYKAKFEQAEKDAATNLSNLKFEHALDGALSSVKAKNPKAVKALLDMDVLRKAYDEKSGAIVNFEEHLKPVKEQNDFLFESDKPAPKIVMGGKSQGTVVNLSMEQIKGMSPADINKNWDAVQATLAAQKK